MTAIRAAASAVAARAGGVRLRSALLAALVVALTLALGALLLLALFRNRLEANLDTVLLQQATDRARLLDQGSEPSGLTGALLDEAFVWIGTPTGVELAVSDAMAPAENPVPTPIGGVIETGLLVEERKPGEIELERMQVRLASATTADGRIVLVGSETERIDRAVRPLAGLFATAIPLLVLIVGGLTWLTTGRALQPVDRIRRRAAAITGSNLSDRVPLPESNDEIRELAVTMNDMLGRLDDHQQSLHRFTADASHELKSPVANVRAMIDTAEIDDDRWPGLADTLRTETDRLRDLVDNLLYLATRVGRAELPTTAVHLDDILFDEAELLAATGRVAVSIDGIGPAEVAGKRSDLERLVRNLVDNAARHATTTVTLGCGSDDSAGTRLTISDDGPGIAEADRARVFERFTRLDDARARDTGGAGLGLPIVRTIADDHAATITIDDAPGGGARIEVVFPAESPR